MNSIEASLTFTTPATVRLAELSLAGCTVVPMVAFHAQLASSAILKSVTLQISHCLGLLWFESMTGSDPLFAITYAFSCTSRVPMRRLSSRD